MHYLLASLETFDQKCHVTVKAGQSCRMRVYKKDIVFLWTLFIGKEKIQWVISSKCVFMDLKNLN